MFDIEVQRCTRRCAKTDRQLGPGETFYSTLLVEGASVVRYDYSAEAWQGSPENALGWWKSQMPDRSAKKLHWAPNEVILDYFEQLQEQPDKQDVRYVLALLMVRRRIARLEETEVDDEAREVLVLYCPRSETQYKVPVADASQERIGEIQAELANLLFAHAA